MRVLNRIGLNVMLPCCYVTLCCIIAAGQTDNLQLVESYRAVNFANTVVSNFYEFYHKMALSVITSSE